MRDKKYVVVTRDTGEKMSLEVAKMAAIPRMLDDLHERLFNKWVEMVIVWLCKICFAFL